MKTSDMIGIAGIILFPIILGYGLSKAAGIDKIAQHPHGDHDCYCPACGTTITVGENQRCRDIYCPSCGQPMRAVETGERRYRSWGPAVPAVAGTIERCHGTTLKKKEDR